MAILMNPLAKKVKLLRYLRFANKEITVDSMLSIIKKIHEYVKKSSLRVFTKKTISFTYSSSY